MFKIIYSIEIAILNLQNKLKEHLKIIVFKLVSHLNNRIQLSLLILEIFLVGTGDIVNRYISVEYSVWCIYLRIQNNIQ